MELQTGLILNHRYRIIRLLGQGGMGAVYYGHDSALDRYVAVKQLKSDSVTDAATLEQVRKQFLREAQSLAALHHPNLPRVTDYFVDEDLHYLVMDYIDGQSLLEIVQANAVGLPENQVLDWADQILAALEYIHQHGLIHRDIKPANLRRTPDGRIFLVDFGLVKLYDSANFKTMTMFHGVGTLEYSPPEQYDPQTHTDQSSDLYSLGATLYHLLSGQVPASLTRRIADPASLQPMHLTNSTVSLEVEQVINRAMELERAKRYATAADMRAALHAARQHSSQAAGVTTGPSRVSPLMLQTPRRSRRVLAWATIPAALLIVVLVSAATQANVNVPILPPTQTNTAAPVVVPPVVPSLTSTATPSPTSTGSATPTATITPTLRMTVSPTTPPTVTQQPSSTRNSTNGSSVGGSTIQPTPRLQNTPPGHAKTPGSNGNNGNNGGGKPPKKK